jgi:hypothetical protein
MKVFFFGAGSSRGTLGEKMAPMAREFGCALKERAPNWETEFPALAKVVEHLNAKLPDLGLERIWTCIDYFDKLQGALGGAPWGVRGDAVPDLKRALLRIYGRDLDREVEKLAVSDKYTLGGLLKRVCPGDVLISFNYDTVVERLAGKFGYDLRGYCGYFRRDVVNFVKPHGSTSWCLDLREKRVTSAKDDGSPLLNSMSEDDVCRKKEPLVLGAVPIKSELLSEIQWHYGVYEVHEVVMRQWKAVVAALRQAELLVVVGYSFPKEDQYGMFLFGEGMRDRPKPLKVEFYDKCDKTKAVEEALSKHKIHSMKWKGEVKGPV